MIRAIGAAASVFALAVTLSGCHSRPTPPLGPSNPGPTGPVEPPVVLQIDPQWTFGAGTPIPKVEAAIGELVTGTVLQTDPACYRDWDASARGRVFVVNVPRDGVLTVTLTSRHGADLFTMFLPFNLMYTGGDSTEDLRVSAGMRVEILVLAYMFPDEFQLTTRLTP